MVSSLREELGASKVGLIVMVVIAGAGLAGFWTMFEGNRITRKTDDAKAVLAQLDQAEAAAKQVDQPDTTTVTPAAATPETPPAPTGPVVPDVFKVKFETTKGDFVIEFDKALAPIGVSHIYELVKSGFYDGCKFFRVVKSPQPFVVQFGINGDPKITEGIGSQNIQDDPVKASNISGTVTYAKSQMPNSRSTQIFINLGDNLFLDKDGFAPIGKVVEGMDNVFLLNGEYADDPTGTQGQIRMQGNAFLEKAFPNLDAIKKATIIEPAQ